MAIPSVFVCSGRRLLATVLCAWLLLSCAPVAGRALVLGVHPYLASTEVEHRFKPLAEYLGRRLGLEVKVKVARDYDAHMRAVAKDRVDIAFLGPAGYVEMVQKYGSKPLLARLVINGHSYFHGMIVKRRENPLGRLEELKGKRFAFGDPESTMSYMVPRYMLAKAGVDLDQLGGYAFLGHHDDVALAVLFGDFDAGGVKEEIYNKYQRRGLVAMAVSPAISEHLFVASGRLSERVVARLREILLAMGSTAKGREVLGHIKKGVTGLGPVTDADYDNLRKILKVVEELGDPQ